MAGAAEQQVHIVIGREVSMVTFGNTKVEVDARGKNVTAYTSESVEITAVCTGPAISAERTMVSVSEDFNTVVLNGVTIKRAADGHLVITAPGTVIAKPVQSNDTPASGKELHVGDRMEDGTVFAGISPDTKAPMYAAPQDAPLTMKWQDAMNYAAGFEGYGSPKGTFRIPTLRELNVLFENRAQIGGFNETGSSPGGSYWSSTESHGYGAYDQRFSDGNRNWFLKDDRSSVRLVRN